ncbi:hypothetical protein ABPG72_015912 [Tetrahymena utriculariae]
MFKPQKLTSLDFQLISSASQKSSQTPTTLQSIQYKGSIINNILSIHLTQSFVSQSDSEYSETIYYFPIQEGICLESFEAKYNQKTIKGIVKDKDQAKQEYQENKNQGNFVSYAQTTSIKDQEYCKIQLGNLPPSQQVEINIIFSQQLNSFLNKYFVAHIPLIFLEDEVSAKLGKNVLTLDLTCTGKILYAESKNYAAEKIMIDDYTARFNLSQALVQKDKEYYQLIYSFEGMFYPQVIFGSSKIFNEDSVKSAILPINHSAMVSFIPNFNEDITQEIDDTIRAAISNGDDIFSDEFQQKLNQELIDHLNSSRSEFIFLLDRSGSMSGQPIRRACEALTLFLKSLPNDSYFNVVSFGSSFVKLFPSSTQYTSESLEKAIQVINNYDADLGGTDIYKPLNSVFVQDKISGYNKQIFLLTDGEVDSAQYVIKLIKKNNKFTRTHSIGFGYGADQYLIKESAIAGKGISKIVDQNCDLSEVIINMLSLCITPTFDEFKIKYDENIFDSTNPSSTNFPCVFKDEIINIHFFFKPFLEVQSLTDQQKMIGIEYYDSQKKQKVQKEIQLEMQDNFNCNQQLQESVFKIGKQLYLNENIQNESSSNQLIQQAIDFQLLTSKTALVCVIEALNDEQKIVYQNIHYNKVNYQNIEDIDKKKQSIQQLEIFDLMLLETYQQEDEKEVSKGEDEFYDCFNSNQNNTCEDQQIINFKNPQEDIDEIVQGDQKACIFDQVHTKAGCDQKFSAISNLQGESIGDLSKTSTQNFEIQQKAQIQNKSTLPKLEDLLNLVNSQGIWKFDNNLLMQLSQIDENNVKKLCSQFVSSDAFMTLVILTILEINYSSQKSKWVLISKKSLSFIKSQLNEGQNYNSIKQNVQSLISN